MTIILITALMGLSLISFSGILAYSIMQTLEIDRQFTKVMASFSGTKSRLSSSFHASAMQWGK